MKQAVAPVIQFKGFHPSDYTVSYLQSVIAHMQEESPYGAALRATFKRQNDRIVGMVKITSAAGRFFAKAQGTRLHEVGHRLNQQMRRHLDKWKTLRLKRGA